MADQNCPLLNLPGELRNRIYGYALTKPKGLLYQNHNGAVKLCTVGST